MAGGGTGLIGDPGGRTDERQLLSEAELAGNIAAVREQLVRYLDFSDAAGDAAAVLVDNATWLTHALAARTSSATSASTSRSTR